MEQLEFFEKRFNKNTLPKVVNIASVPLRSPFRYPGGKTWFVPRLREWLKNKDFMPSLLIEPFAGGGIISLTVLFEELAQTVLMTELDEDVAAVWQTIVEGQCHWLADRILDFNLTQDNVLKELSKERESTREIAFQTILKNRTFHGGILAEGAGLLKHGEAGKGIHSRWYPSTLAERLRNIDMVCNRLKFRKEDGLQAIQDYLDREDVVFFIDPPYTAGGKKAGKRLYTHHEIDHKKLFEFCTLIKGDFLMTYDNAEEVKVLARKHAFQVKPIAMKNTHHAKLTELVIGKNLDWMEGIEQVLEKRDI